MLTESTWFKGPVREGLHDDCIVQNIRMSCTYPDGSTSEAMYSLAFVEAIHYYTWPSWPAGVTGLRSQWEGDHDTD